MGLLKEFREELKKKEEQQKIARLLYGGTQSTAPSSFVAYPGQAPIGYNKGGVVGEHRKMFRKPGLARQALGILASSGELMNEVQPRMRMAQAGAVNKSLFDQATRMVDGMIASGQAPAANRDAAINNLYRYYENQSMANPPAPAPRMEGYMQPADAPIDTSGVRSIPGRIGQGISDLMDFGGVGVGSRIGAEPESKRTLSELLSEGAELKQQRKLAEQVTLENTPATVTPDTGPMGAAASDDPPADLGQDQTANDQNADLLKQLEDLKKERDRLSGLIDKDEKEAIDPFLERYKEMTGNDEDDFYQAMMTAGLAIAGGQSDDAVSNIARGALAGLQQYSKSKKDRRDSLFLAEIQARKLKAAETPATIQTLEILRDNPELQDLYSRTIGKTEKVTDRRSADALFVLAEQAYKNGNEQEGDSLLRRSMQMAGIKDVGYELTSAKKEMFQGSKATVE